jgi:phage shock protein E
MIESLKNLFRKEPDTNYAQLVKDGAVIVDVRSKTEFESGHIKGALNISVEKLTEHLNKIPNKHKPVITCCASGMRSARAAGILKSNGYEQVFNGGGWANLQNKLQ